MKIIQLGEYNINPENISYFFEERTGTPNVKLHIRFVGGETLSITQGPGGAQQLRNMIESSKR